ncbi:hypothetical protein QJQ45_008988 [Haematococcus lacustris]|nr:hypothetical protein QJQ45_008988 [Haematococcus lacustris]
MAIGENTNKNFGSNWDSISTSVVAELRAQQLFDSNRNFNAERTLYKKLQDSWKLFNTTSAITAAAIAIHVAGQLVFRRDWYRIVSGWDAFTSTSWSRTGLTESFAGQFGVLHVAQRDKRVDVNPLAQAANIGIQPTTLTLEQMRLLQQRCLQVVVQLKQQMQAQQMQQMQQSTLASTLASTSREAQRDYQRRLQAWETECSQVRSTAAAADRDAVLKHTSIAMEKSNGDMQHYRSWMEELTRTWQQHKPQLDLPPKPEPLPQLPQRLGPNSSQRDQLGREEAPAEEDNDNDSQGVNVHRGLDYGLS